jgi:hypothetical protein
LASEPEGETGDPGDDGVDAGDDAGDDAPTRRLAPLSIEQVLLEPAAPPGDGPEPGPAASPRPSRPSRRPAAGPVLTAIALGLREVFDPQPKERTQIEQEAPGEPHEPQRYEVHLDPKNPRNSSAVYRPWVDEPGSA